MSRFLRRRRQRLAAAKDEEGYNAGTGYSPLAPLTGPTSGYGGGAFGSGGGVGPAGNVPAPPAPMGPQGYYAGPGQQNGYYANPQGGYARPAQGPPRAQWK